MREFESWWEAEGQHISDATDRAGTPWVRMYDRTGGRVDELLFAPEYWRCLRHGYDPGMTCPYVVSLATAMALDQHGDEALKARFLPQMLRRDDTVWQGATWMTEIRGGSDLGANVDTVARRSGDRWLLTGDKYFASNAGAELAVVAARPESAPAGVRGLALSFCRSGRKWRSELHHPPPERQGRYAFGPHRRSRTAR